jgi:hypothetical protein
VSGGPEPAAAFLSEIRMSNPFLTSMTKLYLPAGMAGMVNVSGFEVTAEPDGPNGPPCVQVPREHVDTLRAHGLTLEAPEPKKAK